MDFVTRGLASEGPWTLHSPAQELRASPLSLSPLLGPTHFSLLLLSSSYRPRRRPPPFLLLFPPNSFLEKLICLQDLVR